MFSKIASIITAATLLRSAVAAPTAATPAEKRVIVEPTCYYANYGGAWRYAVLIPDDDVHDAPGNCGGGFLDNLHGQALTITTWGCTYGWGNYPDSSAVADFYTTIATIDQVQKAYKAATGLDLSCSETPGDPVYVITP